MGRELVLDRNEHLRIQVTTCDIQVVMSEQMVLFVVHDGIRDAVVVSKVIHKIVARTYCLYRR